MIFGKVHERIVGGLRGCNAFVMLIVCVWVVLPVSGMEYATHNLLLEGEMWRGAFVSNGEDQPYVNMKKLLDLERDNFGCATAPLLVSSAGRYVWSERPFSFIVTNNVLTLVSSYEQVNPVSAGKTLRDAFRAASSRHFRADGRMPPAEFFEKPQFNNWIELYIRGTTQKTVENYTEEISDNGFPCGVYMMDGGYMPHQGCYSFVDTDFPDPKRMFAKIRDKGWKSLVWTAHFVSPDSREYKRLRYHKKTAALDLLCHQKKGTGAAVVRWWSGISAVYDLTNPKGRDYYVNELETFLSKYGIDGLKFDAGDQHLFAPGVDVRFYRPEQTGVDYIEEYGRVAAQFPYNEIRSCYKCGGKPLVLRLMDKLHRWKDLRDIIPEMEAAGLCGYAFTVADMIGGGNCGSYPPSGFTIDQKLFVRSCALQALMPMMQFSLAPWKVLSKENLDHCRKFAELHCRFAPYILECAADAAKTGEPVFRSMEYQFPHQGFDRKMQQFMLGSRYLVAPVVQEDDSATVELPAGRWRDDLGEVIEGPRTLHLEKVPLSRLPHYERL